MNLITVINKDKECYKCRKKGHSKRACPSQVNKYAVDEYSDSDSEACMYVASLGVVMINSMRKSSEAIKVSPVVNDVTLEMDLDTGVVVSVIPEKLFRTKFNFRTLNLMKVT